MTGERGAVARVVSGVMYRGHGGETHEVDESKPEDERHRSNQRAVLRQGCGA